MSRIIKKPVFIEEPVSIERGQSLTGRTSENTSGLSAENLAFSDFMRKEISQRKNEFSKKIYEHDIVYKNALDKAYEDGLKKGMSIGVENERRDKIKAIEALLSEAKSKNQYAIQNLEIKVIELAITMAEKIVRKTVSVEPKIMLEIVTDTVSHLIGSEKVILKVAHEDFKLIQERYEKWLALAGGPKEFRIEIDKHLMPGDCLVETEGGIIDGIVSERLNVFFEETIKNI